MIDTEFILELFDPEKKTAIERYIEFMSTSNSDVCLEYEEKHRITDDELNRLIEESIPVLKQNEV